MSEITIIIPFLNEGVEVYNTVQSIREHSCKESVEIMLIDDASSDGFDYRRVAKIFGTSYYRHNKRLGVAESRNEGINLSNTEYFILLDAHMRVFQNDWISIVLDAIKNNNNSIICCQTIPINKNGVPIENFELNYGAYIDMVDLSVKWNKVDFYPQNDRSIIPCVLGASYVSSKSFWNKIKGTKGLKSYGYDEQLISLKSWLAGGNCILVKNVLFGHIYRNVNNLPYPQNNWDFMYNKIYISKLLFNSELFFFNNRVSANKDIIPPKILMEIKRNNSMIESQLSWYKKIFTRDILEIIDINNVYKLKNESLS